jgi:predicted O-methyltransferase YrrM
MRSEILRHRLALFVVLAAPALAGPDRPSAAQLVARHLRAAGGREAVDRITTQIRRGTWHGRPDAPGFPIEVYGKAPGRWAYRMTIPGVLMIERACDGVSAWTQTPDGTETVKPDDRVSENHGFDFQVPFRLAELFPDMTVKGREKSGDREVWAVEVRPAQGKAVVAHFDASTGLLARLGIFLFEDYRLVDGVQVPFTVRALQGGREQVLNFTEVQNNVDVDDSRFVLASNTAAYKRAMSAMMRDFLDRSLEGIDPGAARTVLDRLHGFSPQDGRILYDLIVEKGYKQGLEIGTAEGNSAIWMGMAFKRNGGKLITLEMNAERAKAATENFREAGLEDVVECRVNDAFNEIPALQGPFDLVFMDTGTAHNKRFLDLVYGRMTPGGAITAHNANDFEHRQPDYLKAITTDPNLETKITRTPTGGISVSIRK